MSGLFALIRSSGPLFLRGAGLTVGLWLAATCISLSLGIVFGILRCSRVRIPVVSLLCDAITFMIRGVPYYVQLLIAYFVLPAVLRLDISASVLAAGSLGLCSAAYVSQIIKGAIDVLPIGQWEAAKVLGLSTGQTVRYVILPQLIQAVLPALVGECDQILKSTSIFSSIGILELTMVGKNIIARQMNPIPVYMVVACIYLCMSATLNALSYKAETRWRRL